MYRVKLILADGRKVYHSKRGKIEPYTADEIRNRTGIEVKMAYTKDLFWYTPYDNPVFPKSILVPVVAVVVEPMGTPIDSEAFIIGGQRPTETQN